MCRGGSARALVLQVLLGQLKTCAVLLTGVLFYDAPSNARAQLGAAIAVASIAAYTFISLAQHQAARGNGDKPHTNGRQSGTSVHVQPSGDASDAEDVRQPLTSSSRA